MGMQGPLTAQALGRSPYDEVVIGDQGQENDESDDFRQPTQTYDSRGRPINPDTKRINRDIIRAHNEVMLVIGVAEPENPHSRPEAESQRRHEDYEESIGQRLGQSAQECVEAVGIFGVHGLRQRILIYKRYSRIPFWELFRRTKSDFSLSRDILAGSPTSWLTRYLDRKFVVLWKDDATKMATYHLMRGVWSYFKLHLDLYVALQRLGIITARLNLPHPGFFVPFTKSSPIPPPPPLLDYTIPSLLRWLGGAFLSSAPFLVWATAQRLSWEFQQEVIGRIYTRLPNTVFRRKELPPPPPLPPAPPPPPPPANPMPSIVSDEFVVGTGGSRPPSESQDGSTHPRQVDETIITAPARPSDTTRRASVFSARGDEDISDEEENEGVSATLITFDVEASESHDAPPGVWSAELRPSAGSDGRSSGNQQPVYLDTLLTRSPADNATMMLSDAMTRVFMAPYEAMALRLVAGMFRAREGLPSWDIFDTQMLTGLTGTWAINFLGNELLHLALSSEIWALGAFVMQGYHMTEEEWKAEERKLRRRGQR